MLISIPCGFHLKLPFGSATWAVMTSSRRTPAINPTIRNGSTTSLRTGMVTRTVCRTPEKMTERGPYRARTSRLPEGRWPCGVRRPPGKRPSDNEDPRHDQKARHQHVNRIFDEIERPG